MVRYPADERRSLADVEAMRIQTRDGSRVPFTAVAEAELGRGFSAIRRTDRRRVLDVSADVDLAVARVRLGDEIDRIEGAGAGFHTRVREGYLELAAADPDRWVVVDAGGTVDEVAARVDVAVDTWLAAHW